MTIYISLLIVVLCYWRWRNLYYTRVAIDHRFRMFKLRDQLRFDAIEGRIDKCGTAFRFLDESMSSSIGKVEKYNIYTWAFTHFMEQADKAELPERLRQVNEAMEENSIAQERFHEMMDLIAEQFIRKHYFLRVVLRTAFVVKDFKDWMNRKMQEITASFAVGSKSSSYDHFFKPIA